MGCFSSTAAQVRQARRPKEKPEVTPDPLSPRKPVETSNEGAIEKLLHESVGSIIKGISKIPKPQDLHPLVCLSEYTAPVAIAILSLSSGNTTEIYLPVVAISVFNNRRMMVIGQIGLLAMCNNQSTEASAFLENSVHWTGGVGRNNYRICLLQVEPAIAQEIAKNLKTFDFIVTVQDTLPEFKRFHIIITTMQCTFGEQLRDYMGGLIIADVSENTQEKNMTKFILEHGLGFPKSSLSMGNVTNEFIRTNKGFRDLIECTLLKLVEQYKVMVQDEIDMSVQKYDNLVTALRYHIIVLDRRENEILIELAEAAFTLLKNTNYITEDGYICPSIIHGITVVLLTEILQRMPAKIFVGQHHGNRFPGEIVDPQLDDFKTHHEFLCESWNSSGLYLPSGVLAHAKLSKPCPYAHIQIGAHVECIIKQAGPWKRWPIIVDTYDFNDDLEIDFASPFGGIVYVVIDEFPNVHSLEIDVTFSNLMQYPIYSVSDPASYEEAMRENQSPWTEIETNFIIITVPTSQVPLFGDLSEYCKYIDNIIAEVLQFTCDSSQKLYRLVFDVELPNDKPTCSYPICMPMRMIEDIASMKPSIDLFTLCYYIGTLSMAQMSFGESDGRALGMIAAIHAFHNVFEKIDPLEYNAENPPEIFTDLYSIYKISKPDDFTKSIEDLRRMYELVQVDDKRIWDIFVQKLSGYTGKDYTMRLVHRKTEGGNNSLISYSSKSLSEFQLPDSVQKSPSLHSELTPVME